MKRSHRCLNIRCYLIARNGMGNADLCRAINAIPAQLGNRRGALKMPLPNVWIGVSVEDQRRADERIPDLLATPAGIRFLSAEPLLGEIDIAWALSRNPVEIAAGFLARGQFAPGLETLRGLDLVIAGGASGRGARPMHPDWARSLRDQCADTGTAFFWKQWGEFEDCGPAWGAASGSAADLDGCVYVDPDGDVARRREASVPRAQAMRRVGKNAAGRLLDGREHNDMPEVRA